MGRQSDARERILQAAADVLWEKSFHALTIDEVCARADARKGSLYHFFPSKSALASEGLQFFWMTVARPAYTEHFSERYRPMDRIFRFLGWLRDLQLEKYRERGSVLGWPFFTVASELGSSEPEVNNVLRHIAALETWFFESAFAAVRQTNHSGDPDPRCCALVLRSAIDGVLARARMYNETSELDSLLRLFDHIENPMKCELVVQLSAKTSANKLS